MGSEGADRPGLIAAQHYSMLAAWRMFRRVSRRNIAVIPGETKNCPVTLCLRSLSIDSPGIDIASL